MARRIFFDGLNLALERGTGIATYSRILTQVAHSLGHEVGVVYSSPHALAKDARLRDAAFFDARQPKRIAGFRCHLAYVADHFRCYSAIRPAAVNLDGMVVADRFRDRLPAQDYAYVARNLFSNADAYFYLTRNFVTLAFDQQPDIFHWTYPMPLRAKNALNIYTIHDLVPLRFPSMTLANKRQMYRLFKKIAARADHIVTVSENSRRDIIELLGVDERRVTNTHQAVRFPQEYADRSEQVIANLLAETFGLDCRNYLLFFGALEPKKNVVRLIEAYRVSGVDLPLVIVSGGGWQNDVEEKLIAQYGSDRPSNSVRPLKGRVHRLDYVGLSMLVALISGARAVLAPSLYEGFGLPVLESMSLGTPVVTSRESSLPEIAGEAALLVNPYDPDDIARAIKCVVEDADLWAELSRRGRMQAAKFSVQRYRERVGSLYDALR